MQVKGSGLEIVRVSVSSAPSTSSHGSGQDDTDAVGDVYIWGEVIRDDVVNTGLEITTSTDVLVPRPLECNVALDVHHLACGVRHAALVTRQGEVFTWGEASGGRLGHGVGKYVTQPWLVESLSFTAIDFVACGEFHTCAVTMSGELYSWGDGTHNAGLLGHSNNVSHWIPKRVSGALQGLQVAAVACGPWHAALITSVGQLFTFGDGTFGVLGHGDRKSVSYPREIESLSGLRTVAVACGVWHTAAVVEVIVTPISASISSGKLFTWGDGDKYRLGHGDKESRFKPTCVPALIDYNFLRVACGHSLTVGLTTSGQVFSMGNTVYGQLGNARSNGKLPCLVEEKLSGEAVEDIACGAYHVAALTSKNEVYTWGRGANGRLGHGDVEDRKTPTLVEALKDRHVKFIACGANYSSAICLHKWVSGTEQSQCSGCRQAFGFTRKRHNCYNCGLVHCHACSSRKAIRAAMAPDHSKPYRVCDSCFTKLSKIAEAGVNSRRNSAPWDSVEINDRLDKANMKLSNLASVSNLDMIKLLDTKVGKQGKKGDVFALGDSKPILASSSFNSRSMSPFSRKSTPPRSVTPVPTTSGLSYAKSFGDGLKKAKELLNQEVGKLRIQVESLSKRCELQDLEIRNSAKKAQEAMAIAAEESVKCKAAKEVIKSLTAQLKDMATRLPPGAYDTDSFKLAYLPNLLETNGLQNFLASEEPNQRSDDGISSVISSGIQASELFDNGSKLDMAGPGIAATNGTKVHNADRLPNTSVVAKEPRLYQYTENGLKSEAEWTELYEPGVYITLVALQDGSRDLKRVRFSRRKFGEHQAEVWWLENRERVYERYNIGESDRLSVGGGPAYRRLEGAYSPSSQI